MAEKKDLEKLKEEYAKIQKKYDLPKFEDLDDEFEIREIPPEVFIIREIRRFMSRRMQAISELLEPILSAGGRELHSFIETKIFEKEEIDDLYKFYKHLWTLVHEGITASLETEASEVAFIKKVWKNWPEIKKEAHKYADQLAKGWAKEEKEGFADKYVS